MINRIRFAIAHSGRLSRAVQRVPANGISPAQAVEDAIAPIKQILAG
jgi:hypothetical protein